MKYNDMLKKIRELETQYGISPLCDLYLDTPEERKSYLEWLLNDGYQGDTTMKTEEQREHNQELACLVDDIAFKASLLRIAEKALEDIRVLCVSSTYWNNPDYPNCARLLKQHHKIVSDAKVKAEEMRAIEYGDDVEVPIREHS